MILFLIEFGGADEFDLSFAGDEYYLSERLCTRGCIDTARVEKTLK